MRRTIHMIILFLFISSSLFARSNSQSVQTKRLGVQAGVDETLYVSMVPIAAQSQAFIMGMPFSVDDSLVSYDYTRNGRQIAMWSLLTNTEFEISVDADVLEHVDSDKAGETEVVKLPYYLCFEYALSYFPVNSTEPISHQDAFVIRSEGSSSTSKPEAYRSYNVYESYDGTDSDTNTFSILPNADYTSFIGTLEGSVFFKFAKDADPGNAKGGDYTANVTLTVRSV